ncbi:MAG: NADH-quinone oxidoreductase subunit K [Candidatus Omnitrophica bacterium]|nr:NADH-quinone oxidoreductase subunit K [Candidatus Omnitrophota bacterium]
MIYFLCFVLFSIGVYGVMMKKNIIKLIMSTIIINYSIQVFFVLSGYKLQGDLLVFSADNNILNMVDPIPQIIVLMAILIGLAVNAVLVTIAIGLYQKFETFDITKMFEVKE